MNTLTTHTCCPHFKESKERKIYEKKLQIFAKLIINEYGSKNELDLSIRGFSDFATFQVELYSEEWKDFRIIMRVEIKFTWKELKAKIDAGILQAREMKAGSAGRCPCCYEDLKDVYKTQSCAVCSAILCRSCVDKIRNGDGGVFKCPLCRHRHVRNPRN